MHLPSFNRALGAGAILTLVCGVATLASAVSLDEVRNNVAAHRGQTVEINGRVAGTIRSDKGRTVMIDAGRSGYIYVRDVPEAAKVDNDTRVSVVARVPREATSASELEFVSAAPARPAAVSPGTTTVRVAEDYNSGTVTSAVVPPRPSPSARADGSSRGTSVAAPLSDFERKITELKPAYANAITFFNKRLSPAQRDQIADAVIRFSMLNGLDARLTMAVIGVESSFNPNSTSRSGAMGLGQLMPGTAAGMGVRNAYDPIENISTAVRLIKGHLNNYSRRKDAFSVALAAYNAGSGAVRKHGGVPPYSETNRYIWKVHDLYKSLAPELFRR